MHNPEKLILASGSRWRHELLARLRLPFEAIPPDVDEMPRSGEAAADLVVRLARDKAACVHQQHPDAAVIGSDQVAALDDAIIGKPGTRPAAIEQLHRQSGRTVLFHTGLCVFAPGLTAPLEELVTVETRFRELSPDQIERYVDSEDVTATAGSIKSEGLGITLVESIVSDDPTALVGLPLIALRRMLGEAGIELP